MAILLVSLRLELAQGGDIQDPDAAAVSSSNNFPREWVLGDFVNDYEGMKCADVESIYGSSTEVEAATPPPRYIYGVLWPGR